MAQEKDNTTGTTRPPEYTAPKGTPPDITRTEENMRGRGYRSQRIPQGPSWTSELGNAWNSTSPSQTSRHNPLGMGTPLSNSLIPAWLKNLQQQSIENASMTYDPALRAQMVKDVENASVLYPAPSTFSTVKTTPTGSVPAVGKADDWWTKPKYVHVADPRFVSASPIRDDATFGVSSFMGGGGQAVRGALNNTTGVTLDQANAGQHGGAVWLGDQVADGGGGGGGGGWGGGGGGGGFSSSYKNSSYNSGKYGGYNPLMGLYSWNFKG